MRYILSPKDKINKAIRSCETALENLKRGEKRKGVGDLDYAQDFIIASKMLIINQIEEEEGKF